MKKSLLGNRPDQLIFVPIARPAFSAAEAGVELLLICGTVVVVLPLSIFFPAALALAIYIRCLIVPFQTLTLR